MSSSDESPLRASWLPVDLASDLYVAYEHEFGVRHSLLACYAAFAFIVSPELVNLIRINFLADDDVPWIAEPDFLLSPLCTYAGNGLYQVDPGVREITLVDFMSRVPDAPGVLYRLADFLLSYADSSAAAYYPAEVQRAYQVIAWAHIDPQRAVDLMKETLLGNLGHTGRTAVARARQDQLHVALMLEVVRAPIEGALEAFAYRDLVETARVLVDYWYFGSSVVTQLPHEPGVKPRHNRLAETVVGGLRKMEQSELPATEGQPAGLSQADMMALLRDVLVSLYHESGDIQRLARERGLPLGELTLEVGLVDAWDSVLEAAMRTDAQKIQQIIDTAHKEFPGNQALKEAATVYVQWVEQHGPPQQPPLPPRTGVWYTRFTPLLDFLVDAYEWTRDAERIAWDAGYRDVSVAVTERPLDYWCRILDELQRRSRIVALFDVISDEYPSWFQSYLAPVKMQYQDWATQQGFSLEPSVVDPVAEAEARALMAVRDAAAEGFWRAERCKRLVSEAGMVEEVEIFDEPPHRPITSWHRVLLRVHQTGKMLPLLDLMLKAYPNDDRLQRAVAMYRAPAKSEPPPSQLSLVTCYVSVKAPANVMVGQAFELVVHLDGSVSGQGDVVTVPAETTMTIIVNTGSGVTVQGEHLTNIQPITGQIVEARFMCVIDVEQVTAMSIDIFASDSLVFVTRVEVQAEPPVPHVDQIDVPVQEGTLEAALAMASAIDDPLARVFALVDIAPQLKGKVRDEALATALAAALAIKDESARTAALEVLAPKTSGNQLDQMLATLSASTAAETEGELGKVPTTAFPDCCAISTNQRFTASGVLIAPALVLTADHVRNATQVFLKGSDLSLPADGDTIQVVKIYNHPEVDAQLLFLERPAKTIPRRIAVDVDVAPPSQALFVGFGAVNHDGTAGAGRKRYVQLPITSLGCSATGDSKKYGCLPGKELVAGAPGLNRDSSRGDAGGPLYVLAPDGNFCLLATSSRGARGGSHISGDGGIYVRIDLILDWIRQMAGDDPAYRVEVTSLRQVNR